MINEEGLDEHWKIKENKILIRIMNEVARQGPPFNEIEFAKRARKKGFSEMVIHNFLN